MINKETGEICIADDLNLHRNYTFQEFMTTKYYGNQDGIKMIHLPDTFEVGGYLFYVSLFFKNVTIYLIELICIDVEYNPAEEEKRKNNHDTILNTWGLTEVEYDWGVIQSEYDPKSNVSSINIIYNEISS